jgi:hypothetical protein
MDVMPEKHSRRRKPTAPAISKNVYTIDEFCAAFGISRSFYHTLREAGKGPHEMRLSRKRILIRYDDAQSWALARARER